MPAKAATKAIDPRIRRTQQLLQDALSKLLQQKSFDQISVQDITEAATVNRATFYSHYTDKFRLLECMVARRFQDLLAERQIEYDGTCPSALRLLVLALCDYVVGLTSPSGDQQIEPHMESAIIGVLRSTFLAGIHEHGRPDKIAPEMVAAAAGWATYGAVKEWLLRRDREPGETTAGMVATFVAPMLQVRTVSDEEPINGQR